MIVGLAVSPEQRVREESPSAIHGGIQLKVARAADACSDPGELGALLWREGLICRTS